MRRAILILAVFIIAMVPFLSACDSPDGDLIYWAKLWAIVHDITDEDGNPNFGAVARFTAVELFGIGGSTGDEEGDAAIDNARMLKNLRDAEDAADEGWDNLYKGANVKQDVLPHYDKAIGLRDTDWSYRNGRGIANLEDIDNVNSAQAAKADFDKATELAKKSGKPAEYLRMLRDREQALARLVTHIRETQAVPSKDTYIEQSRTYDELYKLTGDNNYRLLKQQADTNLQQGYFWVHGTVN